MLRKFHWGILGAGHIAGKFADGLAVLPQAIRYAVASRDLSKAEAFRTEHQMEKAYGSYEEMLADPLVDIVYIATPNHLHHAHTLMALNAGKAVLCEKPFATSREQVEEMITLATEKKLFLMEALWTRFLPTITKLKSELKNNAIGTPLMLQAEFGFKAEYNPDSRLFSPELGGGSIPDIGIYPLFLALLLFGEPETMQVTSIPAPTGTDMTTCILLRHKENRISMLTSSFAMDLESDAKVIGTDGTLHLKRMFHIPTRLFKTTSTEEMEIEIPLSIEGNGYNYEAAEVMKALENGQTESFVLPLSFTRRLFALWEKVVNEAKEQSKTN